MMDVLKIAIEISPILLMAAAIVCIPLLSDGPPSEIGRTGVPGCKIQEKADLAWIRG